ncbi:MAG: type II toxin-antitoxin system VapC family toxin [Gemmatales bacterium]
MGLRTLPTSGKVYCDTSVFIYSIEDHPTYSCLVDPLWDGVLAQKIEVITSELTYMETMVGPIKLNDLALVDEYEEFFNNDLLIVLTIDRPILFQAARCRAATGLRTPDAIHVATAEKMECDLIFTNDLRLRGKTAIPILTFDELVSTNGTP